MRNTLLVVPLSLFLLCAGGCIIISENKCGQTASLQKEESRVGGGFMITYLASEDGTAVLVDKKSGKTVQTESLGNGASFEFKPDLEDTDVCKRFKEMGIDLKKADFVLYFYPKNPKPLPPMPPCPPVIRPPAGPVPAQTPQQPVPVAPAQQ